jgi:peptide deformylase
VDRTDTSNSGRLIRLRTVPDPVLNVAARPVERFDERLAALVDEMFDVMAAAGGVGLAAPQVGVSRRVFVAAAEQWHLVVVNPEVVELDGVQHGTEGCLSLPGLWVHQPRPDRVVLRGFDIEGREQHVELTGLGARIACHEIEHLDGVLLDVDVVCPTRRGGRQMAPSDS